jgi:succinate dehydrogenase / fumarate reductase membrane anchor subunit
LQVVVEDYVSNEATRIATNLALKGVIVFCALACAVSVLKLAF